MPFGKKFKKATSTFFGAVVGKKLFFGVAYDPTFTQVTAYPADEVYEVPQPLPALKEMSLNYEDRRRLGANLWQWKMSANTNHL